MWAKAHRLTLDVYRPRDDGHAAGAGGEVAGVRPGVPDEAGAAPGVGGEQVAEIRERGYPLRPEPVVPHVLILQHPAERDEPLATVPILTRVLPGVVVRVGFTWRSLGAAWGSAVDPARWGVLWPGSLPAGAPRGPDVLDRSGRRHAGALDGIVALDGTWSEAKTLWWRNAWLVRLPRIVLQPRDRPLYGALRREPRRGYVSTLEAVGDALLLTGAPDAREALRGAMEAHLAAWVASRPGPGR